MFQQLNLAVWSWVESFRASGRGRLWLPFLMFFAFQLAILFLLVSFAHPLLSWVLVPVFRLLFGDTAVHYPMNLVVLPPVFAMANLTVGVFAWVFTLAISVMMFTSAFQKTRLETGRAFREGRRVYIDVLLTQVPLVFMISLLVFLLPKLVPSAPGASGSAMLIRFQRYGTVAAGILFESLFVAAPLFVVLEGLRAPAAVAKGLKFFFRNVPAVLLLVAVPTILHTPLGYVDRHWRDILDKSAPELLIAVVLLDMALYLLTNFILVGGVTRYYLARRA